MSGSRQHFLKNAGKETATNRAVNFAMPQHHRKGIVPPLWNNPFAVFYITYQMITNS